MSLRKEVSSLWLGYREALGAPGQTGVRFEVVQGGDEYEEVGDTGHGGSGREDFGSVDGGGVEGTPGSDSNGDCFILQVERITNG